MPDTEPQPTNGSASHSADHPNSENEPVWTFRGYRLHPSEFTIAMVHFFRAEVTRANVWR